MLTSTRHHEAEKLAIAGALRDLERSLERFVDSLAHDSGPVNAEDARSEADARRLICEAFATIDYAQDDEVNRSPTCLGIAGVTAAIIDRAEAVNEAKDRLKAVCAPLQDARIRVPVKDGEGGRVVKPLPLVRVLLRELQRSDLSLLAAYRRIPILTGRVQRVAYTRALTRAVYRKSRAEIAAMVNSSNRPAAADDLARLKTLHARETQLALVKERYTNIRANVWFEGLDTRNRGRMMVATELPLLYPHGRSKSVPEIHYPELEEGAPQTARSRVGKLEDAPFLVTLPVYRYRPTPARGHRT